MSRTRPLRILYAAGPGDVVGTFGYWRQGQDDPRVTDIAYSAQFFSLCHDFGAEARVVSSHRQRKFMKEGAFHVENRPHRWQLAHGARYHLGALVHGLSLVRDALLFRADVVVATDVPLYTFLPLARLGIALIPALHSVPWPPGRIERWPARLQIRLAAQVLSRGCYAVLSHEGACVEEVERLTGGRHAPIITFVPIFQRATFASVAERTPPRPPFRLLFAGRVEPEKGVFDLLSVARLLATEGRYDIEFDVCGQGSALSALRDAVAAQGLEARFKIRGFKNRLQLREMFARCHAVIVPSRAQEGFPTVVAEATLAGRPVIATSLCPAVDLVGETAIRVGPGDISAMHDAIVRLSKDDAEYEARRRASAAHRAQFLDGACGWGAALRTALAPLAGLVSSRACSSPGA